MPPTPSVTPGGGDVTPAQTFHQSERVYRDLMMRRFPFETSLGLHVVYLRPYAMPRVSRLLLHTGHMAHASLKRAIDTGMLMYELIEQGLDSPTGRTVVERLNTMHGRWNIRQEDYLWILSTFVVLPVQMADRYGWRKLTDDERESGADWYRELGTRMGITNIPTSYAGFVDFLTDFETKHLRPSDAGQQLLHASWSAGAKTLPWVIRPVALRGFGMLVDEPARSALRLPQSKPLVTAAVRGMLRVRGALLGRRPGATRFRSDAHLAVYPDGYRLDELGVSAGQHPLARRQPAPR